MITLGKKVVFYLKIVLKNQSCQHLQQCCRYCWCGMLFSVTSPFAMIGADNEDLCLLGNIAGALKVEILGHEKFIEKISSSKYLKH